MRRAGRPFQGLRHPRTHAARSSPGYRALRPAAGTKGLARMGTRLQNRPPHGRGTRTLRGRAGIRRLSLLLPLVMAAALAGAARPAGAVPSLSIAGTLAEEGNSGPTAFAFSVTLSNLSSDAMRVGHAPPCGECGVPRPDVSSLPGMRHTACISRGEGTRRRILFPLASAGLLPAVLLRRFPTCAIIAPNSRAQQVQPIPRACLRRPTRSGSCSRRTCVQVQTACLEGGKAAAKVRVTRTAECQRASRLSALRMRLPRAQIRAWSRPAHSPQ